MRNRHLMMGIGIGLIVGALLLQLMNVARNPSAETIYSEEQVRSAAEDLGLKVYDGAEQVYTEQEWKEQEQKAAGAAAPAAVPEPSKSSSQAGQAGSSDHSAQSPAPTKDSDSAGTAKPEDTSGPKASAAPSDVVKLRIAPGASLTDVASQLKKASVISDEDSFVIDGKAWGLTKIIQPGVYSFSKGESFASIAAKLIED